MEKGIVTSFVLFALYLTGTAGEEACQSIDMKAILVRLRDFQTKTHDTIIAMREQITDLEIRNSILEQDIKDLKNKSLDRENNERSLQQQNQQQERKIEIMQKQITVLQEGMTGLTETDLELNKTVQNLTEKSQQQEIVIEAMQEQMTDLRVKALELDKTVQNLTEKGQQQDTGIEAVQEQMTDLREKDLELEKTVQNLTEKFQQQDTGIQAMQEQMTGLTENDLELDKTVQNLTEKCQQQDTRIEAMQEQTTGLREKDLELDKSVQNLTRKSQQQDKEIEGLKLGLASERVAFTARRPRNTSLPVGSIFVFTNKELDTTNSYDNSTGKFTAPVAGNYLFSVQLCLGTYRTFRYKIKSSKATKNVHNAVNRGGHYPDCSSIVTVIKLNMSESIWVETVSILNSNDLDIGEDRWNMFAGVLLSP